MLTTFAVSFGYIFLKSFQQLNVVHRIYWAIPVASLMMAAAEGYIVIAQTSNGFIWATVAAVGLGGGAGSVCATLFHHRYMESKKA